MVSLLPFLPPFSPFSSCPSSAPAYSNAKAYHRARFLTWPPGPSMVQSVLVPFSSLHSSFSSLLLIPKKHFGLLGLRAFAHDLLFAKSSPQITHLLQMTLYSLLLQISAQSSFPLGRLSWPPRPGHYHLPHSFDGSTFLFYTSHLYNFTFFC